MAAAVACAGAAAWLLGGPYSGARRAQLLLAGGGVVGSGPPSWRCLTGELLRLRGRWRPEWWAPVAGLVLAVLAARCCRSSRGRPGSRCCAGRGGPPRNDGPERAEETR